MRLAIASVLLLSMLSGASACASEPERPGKRLRSEIRWVLRETWIFRQVSSDDGGDGALRQNGRMSRLSQQAVAYESDARAIIADPAEDELVKRLTIHVMQCLPLERYVEFVRFVLREVTAGRCAAPLIGKAVGPAVEWSDLIARHHARPEVQQLLKEIQGAGLGAELNEQVAGILDGGKAEYAEHLRSTGLRPESRCEKLDAR